MLDAVTQTVVEEETTTEEVTEVAVPTVLGEEASLNSSQEDPVLVETQDLHARFVVDMDTLQRVVTTDLIKTMTALRMFIIHSLP